MFQLNGKASDQIVPQFHVHIMRKWENDGLSVSTWEMKPGDMEDVQKGFPILSRMCITRNGYTPFLVIGLPVSLKQW
jgi:hypothetical protein